MITLRNHALRSYMTWLPVTLTCLPVTLTLLSYNLQLWRHRRWFRKLPVRFRPIRKEIASSMYNNYTCQYPRLFINFFGFNGIGKCWRFEAWLLRSSKNAFIMQSKSTFLEFFDGNSSLQMWPPWKIFQGQILQVKMTSLQSTMCFVCLTFSSRIGAACLFVKSVDLLFAFGVPPCCVDCYQASCIVYVWR